MKKLFTILFFVVISTSAFSQQLCQASFTYNYNPAGGVLNLTDHSYNYDSTQINVNTWIWTVQYGGASYTYNTQNPTVPINGFSGNVLVCLTIYTSSVIPCQSSICDTINLNTPPPPNTCVAAYTYAYDSLNTSYQFFDQSTTTNGSINSWNWVIRNDSTGAIVYSSNNYQNPVVNLPQNFAYGVCLTITTDSGCMTTYCDSIYVGNTQPTTFCIADFYSQIDSVNHTIAFTDYSYTNNGTINSWSWVINRNGVLLFMSTQQNPVFNYLVDGLYNVCLNTTTDSGCTAQRCIALYVPDSMIFNPCQLTVSSNINHVSVLNGNDGSIDLTVTGATPPYTYAWNTGATTQDIYNLTAGVYTVAISSAPACPSYTYTFAVLQPYDSNNIYIDTLFTAVIDTCLNFIVDSSYISSISVAGNNVTVEWVFMGGGLVQSLFVTYTFSVFGPQVVILNISCGSKNITTYTSYIYISQILGMTENKESDQINLYPNPATDFLNITMGNQSQNPFTLKIFNSAGQQVYAKSVAAKTSQVGINVNDLSSGVYYVQIDAGNGKPLIKKFVK
jgi:PKD repeat protein